MNIYASNIAYVYAHRDIENRKINIGLKTPDGEDKIVYITSISSDEWWERYGLGKMETTYLYIGDVDTARTLEWFALGYGISTAKDKFYNKGNNAHCVDESLLTTEIKSVVIDYIEGKSNGIQLTNNSAELIENIKRIDKRIEDRVYQIHDVYITEIDKYDKNQVRVELVNQAKASEIRKRMMENPALARDTLTPIIVVVMPDGTMCILDGNTRLAAGKKAKGWKQMPVMYINYTEFGSSESDRVKTYDLFGLYANRESFVVKTPNSDEDIKRQINNFLVDEGIDLSNPLHVDAGRQLVYDNFTFIVPSKQKLNGLFKSIKNDFDNTQAELSYESNLITYDDSFFARYCWENYEKSGVATVHVSASEAMHAKALGYILRRMRNVKSTNGAIIFHYVTKKELVKEESEKLIPDLIDCIEYNKLPVTVEVLKPFDE
jgi:hypothetical protein